MTSLLIVAALCASCQKYAEGKVMFRELLALRDQIANEFHEKVADVNVANGDRMTVKFINSPVSTRSREEKQRHADAVAAFVAKHYRHPLSDIRVQFAADNGAVQEIYIGRQNP